MTKAQHTPGPWQWVEEIDYGYGYTTLEGPDGQEVLTTGGINDGDEPITYMGDDSKPADLALIAAAPEMLELLEDFIDVYVKCPTMEDSSLGIISLKIKAKKIVAKAKGE
ncbi:hypothetical protein [Pseudovibrio sp. SPO723]|uniref:hypothetical protein n=1 Tax=Nesiotobacter zosterae TaxID=392721 RepID=UPI0029C20309|nr:hypothetical protein [Pseudovibrio sp. SPO723]MDX5592533.1 hypothetical protein [Pseudovibrio sp. SPO723]